MRTHSEAEASIAEPSCCTVTLLVYCDTHSSNQLQHRSLLLIGHIYLGLAQLLLLLRQLLGRARRFRVERRRRPKVLDVRGNQSGGSGRRFQGGGGEVRDEPRCLERLDVSADEGDQGADVGRGGLGGK